MKIQKRSSGMTNKCCVSLLTATLCLSLAVCRGYQQSIDPVKEIHTNGALRLSAATSGQTGGQQSSACQQQTVGRRMMSSSGPGSNLLNQQSQVDMVKKVFCFYDIQDNFRPQDLNPCLCTHVVYSYVAVRKNLSFIAGKKGDLRSLASLKRKNPNLKLLVSLRPDDYFSFEVPTGPMASVGDRLFAANETVADALDQQQQHQQQATGNLTGTVTATVAVKMNEMHQKFAKRIRDFIVRHSLDGINLDWPYFAQTMQNANASRDHLNLVLLAINENFQTSLAQSSPSSAYLRMQAPIVSLTVSKDFYSLVDVYDFHQINRWVDFVHLPAFDFDLSVDQYSIGHPARLHGISDVENLDTLVDLLLSSGLPREQLIAGIPSHGVQITSRSSSATTANYPVANDPAMSGAQPNGANLDEQLEAAANISIISHAEVCRIRDMVRNNCTASNQQASNGSHLTSASCWTMSRARDLTAPFAYDSEHWVGFDDENSVKLKAKYVLLRQLAGVALFNANNDDPAGECGFGPFPLLATINGVFDRAAGSAVAAQMSSSSSSQQANSESAGNQRTYFTRAPNQLLTATSLMSQLFGKKQSASGAGTTPTPPLAAAAAAGDLMASASDVSATREQQPDQATAEQRGSLMSFVDIIEKYGAVNRLDSNSFAASADGSINQQQEQNMSLDEQLPCTKVGYQRYPRDCSRFYRCVQTPPATNAPPTLVASGRQPSLATTTTTRLQYECPSGLVFDEPFQICNWPSWSAQCTGSGEVNSITNSKFVCPNYGYFQNQENCEYFYYCSDYQRDSHSQAYQFRCPFELGFDEEKLQCNWKWLVKGCNSTRAQNSSLSVTESTGPINLDTSLKVTTLPSLSAPDKQSDARLAATTQSNTFSSTTSVPPVTSSPEPEEVVTTWAGGDRLANVEKLNQQQQLQRRKRAVGEREMRSIAWTSHLASIMASVDAIREHRMKKGSTGAQVGKLNQPPKSNHQQSSSATSESATTTSFRLRRRQSATSSSTAAPGAAAAAAPADSTYSQPVGVLYTRPPAPPSAFPFLPNNAWYMLADSLRSYGEVIQGEVNRYLRVAGDNMRRIFGVRGATPGRAGGQRQDSDVAATNSQADEQSAASRSDDMLSGRYEDDASRLELLLDELDSWVAHPNGDVTRRKKRTKRQVGSDGFSETGDLQALESGPSESWASPSGAQNLQKPQYQMAQAASVQHYVQQQQQQQQQHQQPRHYRDPLSRPPGYPLNQLDELAKSAVMGPEPKLYSQPTALVSNQLSGITQLEYDRLLRSSRDAFNTQYPSVQQQSRYYHQQPLGYSNNNYNKQANVGQDASASMSMASSDVHQHMLPPPLSPLHPSQFSHEKIIGRLAEQARNQQFMSELSHRLHHNNQQQQLQLQQVPYGMPVIIKQQQQQHSLNADITGKKRRPTVAMKLANLAMPKYVTAKPESVRNQNAKDNGAVVQQTTKAPNGGKTGGSYIQSFFPSFTNVVTAPARNIMSKAKDLNKAMQELISTLAPGKHNHPTQVGESEEHKQRATTPIPVFPTRLAAMPQFQHDEYKPLQPQPAAVLQLHPTSQLQHQPQPQPHMQIPPVASKAPDHETTLNANRPSGPGAFNKSSQLYLTEEEARSLSAQLDQLSKEQLEALADSLYANQEPEVAAAADTVVGYSSNQQVAQVVEHHPEKLATMYNQHQSHQTVANYNPNHQSGRPVDEPQDYVVRLLKMLSKTSKNPEDTRLLEQLVGQLNNPAPSRPGTKSIVEFVQPDDLALLEALGLLPNSQRMHEINQQGYEYNQPPFGDARGEHEAPRKEIEHQVAGDPQESLVNSEPVVESQQQQQAMSSNQMNVPTTTQPPIIYGQDATQVPHSVPKLPYIQDSSDKDDVRTTTSTELPTTQSPETTVTTTTLNRIYEPTSILNQSLANQQYFESQVIDKTMAPTVAINLEAQEATTTVQPLSAQNPSIFRAAEETVGQQVVPSSIKTSDYGSPLFMRAQMTSRQRISSTTTAASNDVTTEATTTTTVAPAETTQTLQPARQISPVYVQSNMPLRVDNVMSVELTRSRKVQPNITEKFTSNAKLDTNEQKVVETDSSDRKRKSKRKSRTSKNRHVTLDSGSQPAASSTTSTLDGSVGGSGIEDRQKVKVADRWTATKSSANQYAIAATYVPVGNHGFRSPSYPMIVDKGEQVAIYGTKSGFMPMINSEDSSYGSAQPAVKLTTSTTQSDYIPSASRQNQQQVATNSLSDRLSSSSYSIDPLSFSASFVSSKRQQLGTASSDSALKRAESDGRKSGQTGKREQASWKNFVRSLNDQISVVNLGNYSEPKLNSGGQVESKLIKVKLVILPASPNNELLEPANWQQLSRYYPQLFPAALNELNVEPIDLGPSSLSARDTSSSTTRGYGQSINESAEEMRLDKFMRQFEPISRLIERKTLKALDEIIQRSHGKMFMMQHKAADASRTIIAVIPERKSRRNNHHLGETNRSSSLSPNYNANKNKSNKQTHTNNTRLRQKPANKQEISHPLPLRQNQPSALESTSTTTTDQPSSTMRSQTMETSSTTTTIAATVDSSISTTTTTQLPIDPESFDSAPRKAAAFSRAIQDQIQGAIRQHYKVMKNQLRQSISEDIADPSKTTSTTITTSSTTTAIPTTTEAETIRTAGWSTPPAESMLNMLELGTAQPPSNLLDPLDTASSSTEYSLARLGANDTVSFPYNATNSSASAGDTSYSSHSVYEVDGAESKSLYGLDLNSQQMEQELYFKSVKTVKLPQESNQKSLRSVEINNNQTEQVISPQIQHHQPTAIYGNISRPQSQTARPRFISIGSHLISSPMKLPKVVDQAYVNHFYDHIGDYQLAKAVGLDELVHADGNDQIAAPNGSSDIQRKETPSDQQRQQHADSQQPNVATNLSEDSLVPETACTRAGLFQHPFACNKFYECFWDKQLSKFTLHMFECPIKLAFDDRIVGCAMPIESSLCVNY